MGEGHRSIGLNATCRTWLSLNPVETELSVRGEVPVRYTLRVPPELEPGSYFCAVGFTSLPPAAAMTGFGVRTAVRVVGAIYVIAGNPAIAGRLSQIAVERVPGSERLRAVVVIENSGKMFFRPTGVVTVLSASGQELEKFDINPLPILPERKQRLLFALRPGASEPSATIRVRVDLGTGEIQEGTAVIAPAR